MPDLFPDLLDQAPVYGDRSSIGHTRLHALLRDELGKARAELLRVDTKANTLLALAGVLLGGGLAALAGADHLSVAVTVTAWTGAVLLGGAVILLGAAVRPDLRGSHGFVRWAHRDAPDLLTDLDGRDPLHTGAQELHAFSRLLLRKYTLIRRSVTLIVAGLVVAAVAAALATVGAP